MSFLSIAVKLVFFCASKKTHKNAKPSSTLVVFTSFEILLTTKFRKRQLMQLLFERFLCSLINDESSRCSTAASSASA
jgi:hypothetical protein